MYFDVTVMAGYRVGTDSLCKYISKHPNIYCPGYYGTKFRANTYSDKTFIDVIGCKRNVFIWHDINVDFIYSSDIPLKNHHLIHPIRHPYEQAIASYNSFLQQLVLDNKDIPDVEEYILRNGELYFNSSLRCSKYYDKYEKVKIVDFSELARCSVNRTMNDIYQWLGVEECANFVDDSVFKKSYVDTFLEKLPLRISYKGIYWTIHFVRLVDFIPKYLYKIGSINTDDFGILAMCMTKDEIYINRARYNDIIAKELELIIESHFSTWSDELNHKLDFFMMKKINSLPQKIYSLIDNECESDYEKIIEYCPKIEMLWRDKWI